MPNNQAYALLATARLFAMLAMGAPALWFRDSSALLVLLAIGVLWLYQTITSIRRELELTLTPPVEAGAVGILCALGMHYSSAVLRRSSYHPSTPRSPQAPGRCTAWPRSRRSRPSPSA